MIMQTFTYYLKSQEGGMSEQGKFLTTSLLPLIPEKPPETALIRHNTFKFMISLNRLGHMQQSHFIQQLVLGQADIYPDIQSTSSSHLL